MYFYISSWDLESHFVGLLHQIDAPDQQLTKIPISYSKVSVIFFYSILDLSDDLEKVELGRVMVENITFGLDRIVGVVLSRELVFEIEVRKDFIIQVPTKYEY